MIRLETVTVVRGATPIVSDLDLELRAGRVFWVVGPNGAGKTSLLRVIIGLDPPRAGAVIRDGPPPSYFHSEMAIPGAASVGGWERFLDRVGAGPGHGRTAIWPDVRRRKRVGRLSTGERKRLLLEPLLRRPGPLVLDEPFEHLSPEAKDRLDSVLADRARSALVVVATNQVTARAVREGGLHLEAGAASLRTAR